MGWKTQKRNIGKIFFEVVFATCDVDACPGGGIVLRWLNNFEFCWRSIAQGTVPFALDKGGGGVQCLMHTATSLVEGERDGAFFNWASTEFAVFGPA